MSVHEREWQPGDKALVEVEVLRSFNESEATVVLDDVEDREVRIDVSPLRLRPVSGGGEVEAATEDVVERLRELEEELARTKRGAKTLGSIVERQCRDILEITGMHHLIDEDGDGDWGAVWDRAFEMRELLTATTPGRSEAEIKAEALAKVKALRPFSEQDEDDDGFTRPTITFLRDEWDEAIGHE